MVLMAAQMRRCRKPLSVATSLSRSWENPVQIGLLSVTTRETRDPNEVYLVSWHAGREKKGQTCVSIRKYGELGAFRRACAIRRQKEQEMYGNVVMSKWAETLGKVCAA